jgi:hypothetical protein
LINIPIFMFSDEVAVAARVLEWEMIMVSITCIVRIH